MTLSIQNFIVQYSNVNFNNVAAAAPQLFITEGAPLGGTPALTNAQVNTLTSHGTMVLGYVESSVTDANRTYWNPAWTSDGTDTGAVTASAPEWLKTGATNPFGIVVDVGSAAWIKIVIDQAVDLVTRGYSGIFLDDVSQYYTLGNTLGNTSSYATKMMELVVQVKAAITAINPNAVIVVNSTPYIVTDGTGGISSTASQAFLHATDGMLIESYFGIGRPAEESAITIAKQNILPSMSVLSLEFGGTDYQNFLYQQQAKDLGFIASSSATAAYNTLGATVNDATNSADMLLGTARADMIFAKDGNDTIAGMSGNDFIDGGNGIDTAIFTGASTAYTKSFDPLTGLFHISGGTDGSDSIKNVELFQFNDGVLTAGQIQGVAEIMNGTNKADTLVGTFGADTICGDRGNDLIKGGGGNDFIDGGRGIDTAVYVGSSRDYVKGYDAQTRLFKISGGPDGSDTLKNVEKFQFSDGVLTARQLMGFSEVFDGTKHNDTLLGTIGADTINGYRGDDILNGNSGDDFLTGGRGADRFVFSGTHFGHDTITDFVRGTDKISLLIENVHSLADIQIVEHGGCSVNVLIGSDSITIHGDGIHHLSATDFLFI
jgi:Ca2+-binding RTX toxin-like protein